MFNNSQNQIFQYNGSPITFQKGDSVMVNATQMAKSFGKEPKFWLMNQSTTDFLNELSKVRNLTLTDLVQVTKGGNNPGTWMHEDVAMEFARWLSPAFAIWCNDRIKELLQYGMTATQPTLEQMINNPDLVISLATQLKSEREEKHRLEQQNALQEEQLRQAAPKVQYVDTVLQSVNTYATNLIAKEMGMSAETLNKRLKEKGIQYRQSGVWVLTSKYQNKGYTKTRTHTYTRSDGSQSTAMLTVWTEQGRAFLHSLFKA
jgi:phage antirepressor YoqD-like protein